MFGPQIIHDGPATNLFSYWIGRLIMFLWGWDVIGETPKGSKFVLIAAPHTSNWDFLFSLGGIYIFRLKVSWIMKKSLFKWPIGWLIKWLGGVPIDRENPEGLVDQIVQQFKDAEKLVILIPPSGTRSKREYWKNGFYRIALEANVPILCAYLDYSRKVACFGISFIPTGNVKQDMDRIRDFYADVQGKHPERTTTIRLKNEAQN